MEVERKFLVDEAPPVEGCESSEIDQGYLAIARGRAVATRSGCAAATAP